ncbi:MAG: pseudouridine synthase [Candidatus Peribacteraceae bacterium]|nr:pseudouridine synthase [Candidatus Peribacteraceae bacterium]
MPPAAERILFCDASLLAVNKLSGELVVRGKGEGEKLPLLDFLKQSYPGLWPLHRLDFETSGVVVFARTRAAFAQVMATKFRGWKKIYRTLVMGRIERTHGTIRIPLPAREGGKVEAVTHYRILDRFANSTFLEAEIETGRHHQIRRHFAAIGHPLVLDHVYGHKRFNGVFTQEFHLRRFFLHAFSVDCPHPVTGESLHIEAPMPRAFEDLLQRLRSLS